MSDKNGDDVKRDGLICPVGLEEHVEGDDYCVAHEAALIRRSDHRKTLEARTHQMKPNPQTF